MEFLVSSLLLLLVTAFAKSAEVVKFPENFKFATASSAYQIEGAWNVDGKASSIWDTFTHNRPEMIADGSNGDVSIDSYHFYEKDIEALKAIGFKQYRFSISWSRVLVNGSLLNQKGIEYYNNLIDALLREGIEPIATMYHFDLPQAIQDLGGFTNPIVAKYFKHFADVLFEHFGDRVKSWITFNEPLNFCTDGYGTGKFAPGIKSPGLGEYLCGHFVLQAHAAAYHLYKEKYFETQRGQIGIALNSWFTFPKNATVDAPFAEKALEFKLGWFANPIFSKQGGYPQVMIDQVAKNSKEEGRMWSRLPVMSEEMKRSLIGSADFFGLNYYTSRVVARKTEKALTPSHEEDIGVEFSNRDDWVRAKSEWLYKVPEGLHGLLVWIKNKYDNPEVVITENGFSDEGDINDEGRIEYFKGHLTAVSEALADGCNINGYTVWSLVDNFEWIRGYTEKFGIFAVNLTSVEKERTKKKSAEFIKKLIADKSFLY